MSRTRAGQEETSSDLGAMGGLTALLQRTRVVFIPTWYVGLINALLTALGLSWQHFPFKTCREVPHAAGALGVRKQQVSGYIPLSPLMMAKPWNTAFPLLFALLVLVNKPSSLSSCTTKMPSSSGCPLPLFELPECLRTSLSSSWVILDSLPYWGHARSPHTQEQAKAVTSVWPLGLTTTGGADPLEAILLSASYWDIPRKQLCAPTFHFREQLGDLQPLNNGVFSYSSSSPGMWAGE